MATEVLRLLPKRVPAADCGASRRGSVCEQEITSQDKHHLPGCTINLTADPPFALEQCATQMQWNPNPRTLPCVAHWTDFSKRFMLDERYVLIVRDPRERVLAHYDKNQD